MVYYAWPSKLIVYLKLFYKSHRPHFLWVYWLDNQLGMLGEHLKSLLTRSSPSIKIGIDLSINKSIKIGKHDVIDINCINQSVESMTHSFRLSIYKKINILLDFTHSIDFYRKIHLFFCSSKNEN